MARRYGLQTAGWLALSLWAGLAAADELWLVELEEDDGVELIFKGAGVVRGNAPVWQQGAPRHDRLKPGERLALWVSNGAATRIDVLQAQGAKLPADWQRGQDQLVRLESGKLRLRQLGTVPLAASVRWVNGSAADLQPGREVVLRRNLQGEAIAVLIPNPEDDDVDRSDQ